MDPDLLNLDLPPTIETERLTIRGLQPGDGAAFNAALLETLEELQFWMGMYPDGPPTVEQSEAYVRQKSAEFVLRQYLMLVGFLKGTDTVVVASGLRPTWDVPMFEIGYWCRKSYQRQGYVTETVIALADFAFANLNAKRVYICCDVDNHASANVARRAGFDFEGTIRHDSRKTDGRLSNTYFFSQIRPD